MWLPCCPLRTHTLCPRVKLITAEPPAGDLKATNEITRFKELIEPITFLQTDKTEVSLGPYKVAYCFSCLLFVKEETSGLTNEDEQGRLLEEINFIGKSFLLLTTLDICGTALSVIDSER